MKHRDLGLTFDEAMKYVAFAVGQKMEVLGIGNCGEAAQMMMSSRAHIDGLQAQFAALSSLLISRGHIGYAEYAEAMRLALNEELARYKDELEREMNIRLEINRHER